MKRILTYVSHLKVYHKLGILLFACIVVLAACNKHDHPPYENGNYDVVYIQTNDFRDGQNAVLAYIDKGDGKLLPLKGSPFFTKGSGIGNPMQVLGPADSDYELRISSDGKYLLVVNSGSNTIAVFAIKEDGSLEHVLGSPFPSGGETPCSIDVSDNYVYVVNKSDNPLHPTASAPNYVTFKIDAAGKLTQVPGAKFETAAKTSPSQILVSRDKRFLFGDDWLGFMLMPPKGTLRSFTSASGKLTPVSGTPYILPAGKMPPDNGALGLWQHPSGNPLYVGIPLEAKVAVYYIDNKTGALSLQKTVAAGAAACWIRTNEAGNHMYVLNSGDNTVQVYNTANPMSPASVQTLQLKKSGPSYSPMPGLVLKTSEDFSLALSPSEKILYVVCQHTNKDFSIGNYNYLHSLAVADDGKLTEVTEPLQIPVPNTVRPKGSAVISVYKK